MIGRLRRLFTEAGFDGTAVVLSTPGAYQLVLPPASRIDVDVDVAQGGSDFAGMRHSFEARDWDTFAAGFAPDCAIADYRTAGWGDVDRETFVEYQRSVVALAADARLWVDHARERGNVGLSVGRAFGTRDGGAWEIPFASVGRVGPDDAGTHLENYELTDFAVALRRFEELTD